MAGRLAGRVAIVTGAASGFGRATATLFAAEGAHVVVGDLDASGGRETVDRIRSEGAGAELVVGDVADRATALALVERAVSSFGQLDVLVNNAGIAQPSQVDTWNVDESEWDRVIQTDLRSIYTCCRAAIPAMIDAGGGAIVNVSSISVRVSIGGSAYAAAKGGMLSYTRASAPELAPKNIRINCVSPGMMRTPMLTGERMGLSPTEQQERIAALGQLVPMGHCGSVDDIAHAVLFLSSDEAAYITGQEIVVDGGYVVRAMMTAPPGGYTTAVDVT
jgi:NAD(P)-dependent dehydrogenase (short-subunit alcohol dehydrogenase family)